MPTVRDRVAKIETAAVRAQRRVARRAEEINDEAEELLALATETSSLWTSVCQAVLDGRTEEGHAIRDGLKQAVEKVQSGLQEGTRLLPGSPRSALASQLEEIGTLRRNLERWQTAEDLEYLVAEAVASRKEFTQHWPAHAFPEKWRTDELDVPV